MKFKKGDIVKSNARKKGFTLLVCVLSSYGESNFKGIVIKDKLDPSLKGVINIDFLNNYFDKVEIKAKKAKKTKLKDCNHIYKIERSTVKRGQLDINISFKYCEKCGNTKGKTNIIYT